MTKNDLILRPVNTETLRSLMAHLNRTAVRSGTADAVKRAAVARELQRRADGRDVSLVYAFSFKRSK